MMRIARVAVAFLLSAGLAASPVAVAGPASDADTEARKLYAEGERAYRVGEFDVAAEKFQAAYDLAPQAAALLYNLGLAYKRLFETDEDVADGRKAKAVLQNFLVEIQKDPGLGDEEEIKRLLGEVDAKLEELRKADEAEKAREAELEKERLRAQSRKTEPGADPGKKNRVAGYGLLGGGSAVFVGGVAMVVAFGVYGEQFESDLQNCDTDACRDTARNNGQQSNLLAYAVGIPIAVVGAAAIGIGAWQLSLGNKRTREWRAKNELSIVPTGNGLVFSGRF